MHIPSFFQSLFIHNSAGFKAKDLALNVVAPIHWSQFKAAADFQIKCSVEVLKTETLGLVTPEVFEIP